MNWWGILKATWDPNNPNQLTNIEQGQATSGNVPPRNQGQTFSNITQRTPQQNNPNQSPRLTAQPPNQPINTNTAVDNQQVQAGQGGQQSIQQEFISPENPSLGMSQNQQNTTSAEAGGADDSDVGETRQNVQDAKSNLTQLPRGPKAAEITQALKLLSDAAIDPVKQKEIAIEAKKILHQVFPSSMA